MPDESGKRSDLRHDRLAAIVAEHSCAIRDRHTACAFLAGAGETPRFAAATSEGAPVPGLARAGTTLVAAEYIWVLSGVLGRECDEGRLAYGRVWDLDAPWTPGGNLDISYYARVSVGSAPPIYGVTVAGREEGSYLFDDLPDAEEFADAIRRSGGAAELSEELLYDRRGAEELIDAEAARLRALRPRRAEDAASEWCDPRLAEAARIARVR